MHRNWVFLFLEISLAIAFATKTTEPNSIDACYLTSMVGRLDLKLD